MLQVLHSEVTRRAEAGFEGGGSVAQVRARRDGTSSIAMVTRGFVEENGEGEKLEESRSWRTIGIDYGRSSGADVLMVMVEGNIGLADRHQVWEASLGDVPAERVKLDGQAFEVRPEGTSAVMRGTFLYPTTVFLEYQAPREGRPGRLRAHRQKPGEKSLQAMWNKLDAKLDAQIQAMLKGEDSNIDITKFDLPLEEPNAALAAQLQRQSEIVYVKLLKETSSIKMGAPDRRPRAKGNLVLVMTLGAGPAPAVKLLDTKTPALVSVGGQTVTYRENLVEFGK